MISVFIDANIFLEIFLAQKKKEKCVELLEKIKNGKIVAFTSNFIVFGVSLILEKYAKKPEEIKSVIENLFSIDNLKIYDLTPSDLIDATKLMKKYGLGLEDSLCLQGAVINNSERLVSFDKDFDKVTYIKRTEPSELLK